jgi:all-trans-retinol 13,14-reductase
LSTEHFSAHPHGELYGVDHTPERFAVPLRAQTHVKGLYLTGADLVSAGVAGALMGGVLSAGSILGFNALRKIMRPG